MHFISSPEEGPLLPHVLPNELKDLYDEMYSVHQRVFSCPSDETDTFGTGKPWSYFILWQAIT